MLDWMCTCELQKIGQDTSSALKEPLTFLHLPPSIVGGEIQRLHELPLPSTLRKQPCTCCHTSVHGPPAAGSSASTVPGPFGGGGGLLPSGAGSRQEKRSNVRNNLLAARFPSEVLPVLLLFPPFLSFSFSLLDVPVFISVCLNSSTLVQHSDLRC